MGKIARPTPKPEHQVMGGLMIPEPEIQRMGDIAIPTDVVEPEPCDPIAEGPKQI
jgi:hypothetical protein